jgi:hypothetical protein
MKTTDPIERAIPPLPGGGSWCFDTTKWAWQSAAAAPAAPTAPTAPAEVLPADAAVSTTTEE